jgi:hypothetical protein
MLLPCYRFVGMRIELINRVLLDSWKDTPAIVKPDKRAAYYRSFFRSIFLYHVTALAAGRCDCIGLFRNRASNTYGCQPGGIRTPKTVRQFSSVAESK